MIVHNLKIQSHFNSDYLLEIRSSLTDDSFVANHSSDEGGTRSQQHPDAELEQAEELDVHVVERFLILDWGLSLMLNEMLDPF